jgi:hypothetical protein
MSQYTAGCTACPTLTRGAMTQISKVASQHEKTTKHRVQVWPTSSTIAPLPRKMWVQAEGAVRCMRVACYDQRNGRECWMAEHSDGRYTFGYRSQEEAAHAAVLHYDETDPLMRAATC